MTQTIRYNQDSLSGLVERHMWAQTKARIKKTRHSKSELNEALVCAAEGGAPAAVFRALLAVGASPNARGDDDASEPVIVHAVRANKGLQNVRLLLEHGAKVPRSLVFEAASHGNTAALRFLLAIRSNLNAVTDRGDTLLHVAAAHGEPASVKLLLEAGADPHAEAENGESPLHFACTADSILLLVKAGVSPDVQNELRQTPLHYAASSGNVEAVDALLKAGASVNALDTDGNNAIRRLSDPGARSIEASAECLRLMVSAGADYRHVASDGESFQSYLQTRGVNPVSEQSRERYQFLLNALNSHLSYIAEQRAKSLQATPPPKTRARRAGPRV